MVARSSSSGKRQPWSTTVTLTLRILAARLVAAVDQEPGDSTILPLSSPETPQPCRGAARRRPRVSSLHRTRISIRLSAAASSSKSCSGRSRTTKVWPCGYYPRVRSWVLVVNWEQVASVLDLSGLPASNFATHRTDCRITSACSFHRAWTSPSIALRASSIASGSFPSNSSTRRSK